MRDGHNHKPSGKCKLKPQWDIPNEMAIIKKTIMIIGKDKEKLESSHIADGNVKLWKTDSCLKF